MAHTEEVLYNEAMERYRKWQQTPDGLAVIAPLYDKTMAMGATWHAAFRAGIEFEQNYRTIE